jgi:hypothetical protein
MIRPLINARAQTAAFACHGESCFRRVDQEFGITHLADRAGKGIKILRSVLRSGKILMQNGAILRNALRKRNYESLGVSNDMQSSETLRNSLGLN